MKTLWLVGLLLVLALLAGCMPVQPEAPTASAAPQAVTPPQTVEEKIAQYSPAPDPR